jgi:NAD+ synthase (glutamine-hydrolysing)
MRLVRIGTAAVSVKVGDFPGNAQRLREAIHAARDAGTHLLVTPELAISGYSLEDRIFWPDIAKHSWECLEALAEECKGISVFLGLPVRIGAMMHNAAAMVHDGKILGLLLKRHLPTYSIFYEARHWTAWRGGVTEVNGVPAGDLVFRLPYGCVSGEICEDLWSSNSPAHARVAAGAEIICNPSASPFTPRKNEARKGLVLGAASSLKAIYAYANLLGCDNSRLVFDGGGIIASPEGIACEAPILSKKHWTFASAVVDLGQIDRVRSENTTWREGASENAANGVQIIDASNGAFTPAPLADWVETLPPTFYNAAPCPAKEEESAFLDELYDALVLGLRDYFEKVGAFERFLVALSGGRDSALCLLMAVDAAKAMKEGQDAENFAQRVHTVYLPNKAYSTSGTENAARALATELGVPFDVVSIHEEAELAKAKAAELVGGENKIAPMALQNLQARIRGAMMLNWGNSVGGLLLVTSNLSEAAVGYTTTGGDNEGGFSPIANLPKTLVSRLLEYLAQRDGIKALEDVLAIPPSAELAPDQKDETDLMPYVVLDDLLYLYAWRRHSLAECWRIVCHRHKDHDPEQLRQWTADFGKRFSQNQWKRDQHPVSLKVMDLDLDPKTGFRFPVTQSIDYELAALEKATMDE